MRKDHVVKLDEIKQNRLALRPFSQNLAKWKEVKLQLLMVETIKDHHPLFE